MPMTKRLGAYADIAAAFDAALDHDGGSLEFDTVGKARNWRQRAYYYRQLLGTAKPEYDKLQLHHEDVTVTISLVRLNAVFTTPAGIGVAVKVVTDQPQDLSRVTDDPLLDDALALVQTNKEQT